MENPNSWDGVTRLIDETIAEWYKQIDAQVCTSSLAITIRDALAREGYLNEE